MRAEFFGGPIDILFLTESVDPADQFMTRRRRCQRASPSLLVTSRHWAMLDPMLAV